MVTLQRGLCERASQEPGVRNWSEVLDIDVTKNTMERALRIMDAPVVVEVGEQRGRPHRF